MAQSALANETRLTVPSPAHLVSGDPSDRDDSVAAAAARAAAAAAAARAVVRTTPRSFQQPSPPLSQPLLLDAGKGADLQDTITAAAAAAAAAAVAAAAAAANRAPINAKSTTSFSREHASVPASPASSQGATPPHSPLSASTAAVAVAVAATSAARTPTVTPTNKTTIAATISQIVSLSPSRRTIGGLEAVVTQTSGPPQTYELRKSGSRHVESNRMLSAAKIAAAAAAANGARQRSIPWSPYSKGGGGSGAGSVQNVGGVGSGGGDGDCCHIVGSCTDSTTEGFEPSAPVTTAAVDVSQCNLSRYVAAALTRSGADIRGRSGTNSDADATAAAHAAVVAAAAVAAATAAQQRLPSGIAATREMTAAGPGSSRSVGLDASARYSYDDGISAAVSHHCGRRGRDGRSQVSFAASDAACDAASSGDGSGGGEIVTNLPALIADWHLEQYTAQGADSVGQQPTGGTHVIAKRVSGGGLAAAALRGVTNAGGGSGSSAAVNGEGPLEEPAAVVAQVPAVPAPTLGRGPRNRSTRYKGVSLYRRTGRFEAHIWHQGRQLHIGTYGTDVEAALAYDRVSRYLRGTAAVLNFPSEAAAAVAASTETGAGCAGGEGSALGVSSAAAMAVAASSAAAEHGAMAPVISELAAAAAGYSQRLAGDDSSPLNGGIRRGNIIGRVDELYDNVVRCTAYARGNGCGSTGRGITALPKPWPSDLTRGGVTASTAGAAVRSVRRRISATEPMSLPHFHLPASVITRAASSNDLQAATADAEAQAPHDGSMDAVGSPDSEGYVVQGASEGCIASWVQWQATAGGGSTVSGQTLPPPMQGLLPRPTVPSLPEREYSAGSSSFSCSYECRHGIAANAVATGTAAAGDTGFAYRGGSGEPADAMAPKDANDAWPAVGLAECNAPPRPMLPGGVLDLAPPQWHLLQQLQLPPSPAAVHNVPTIVVPAMPISPGPHALSASQQTDAVAAVADTASLSGWNGIPAPLLLQRTLKAPPPFSPIFQGVDAGFGLQLPPHIWRSRAGGDDTGFRRRASSDSGGATPLGRLPSVQAMPAAPALAACEPARALAGTTASCVTERTVTRSGQLAPCRGDGQLEEQIPLGFNSAGHVEVKVGRRRRGVGGGIGNVGGRGNGSDGGIRQSVSSAALQALLSAGVPPELLRALLKHSTEGSGDATAADAMDVPAALPPSPQQQQQHLMQGHAHPHIMQCLGIDVSTAPVSHMQPFLRTEKHPPPSLPLSPPLQQVQNRSPTLLEAQQAPPLQPHLLPYTHVQPVAYVHPTPAPLPHQLYPQRTLYPQPSPHLFPAQPQSAMLGTVLPQRVPLGLHPKKDAAVASILRHLIRLSPPLAPPPQQQQLRPTPATLPTPPATTTAADGKPIHDADGVQAYGIRPNITYNKWLSAADSEPPLGPPCSSTSLHASVTVSPPVLPTPPPQVLLPQELTAAPLEDAHPATGPGLMCTGLPAALQLQPAVAGQGLEAVGPPPLSPPRLDLRSSSEASNLIFGAPADGSAMEAMEAIPGLERAATTMHAKGQEATIVQLAPNASTQAVAVKVSPAGGGENGNSDGGGVCGGGSGEAADSSSNRLFWVGGQLHGLGGGLLDFLQPPPVTPSSIRSMLLLLRQQQEQQSHPADVSQKGLRAVDDASQTLHAPAPAPSPHCLAAAYSTTAAAHADGGIGGTAITTAAAAGCVAEIAYAKDDVVVPDVEAVTRRHTAPEVSRHTVAWSESKPWVIHALTQDLLSSTGGADPGDAAALNDVVRRSLTGPSPFIKLPPQLPASYKRPREDSFGSAAVAAAAAAAAMAAESSRAVADGGNAAAGRTVRMSGMVQ